MPPTCWPVLVAEWKCNIQSADSPAWWFIELQVDRQLPPAAAWTERNATHSVGLRFVQFLSPAVLHSFYSNLVITHSSPSNKKPSRLRRKGGPHGFLWRPGSRQRLNPGQIIYPLGSRDPRGPRGEQSTWFPVHTQYSSPAIQSVPCRLAVKSLAHKQPRYIHSRASSPKVNRENMVIE